jgi:hypothetical protein
MSTLKGDGSTFLTASEFEACKYWRENPDYCTLIMLRKSRLLRKPVKRDKVILAIRPIEADRSSKVTNGAVS